jgi:hypothetical protein
MEGRGMSWWFKMPADAGERPEILAVGWSGFCAWLALLGVNAQQDFGGRLPRRFASPAYLRRRFPDDGPGVDLLGDGLGRCVAEGLASWEGDTLVLTEEIYADWRAPMSTADRVRKHRAGKRNVADETECNAVKRGETPETQVTVPDQTRPDQTRPESESPPAHAREGQPQDAPEPGNTAAANVDAAAVFPAPAPSGLPTARADAAWRLAEHHDHVGHAVAQRHGKGWRSLGTAGPGEWSKALVNGATEDECRHVMAMLAAEADERARLGMADPLRFLRTPTSPEIWRRAAGLPDEEAAREAVRARVAGNSNQPPPAPEPKRRARRLG